MLLSVVVSIAAHEDAIILLILGCWVSSLSLLRYERRHVNDRREQKGKRMSRDYIKGIFNKRLQE